MSNASSLVAALGVGSGIDTAKLAGDLSAARFAAQVKQLEGRRELLDTRISAAAELKSRMSELANALGERVRDGSLGPTATVANAAVATASVASGGRASGSYSLEVTRLASAQVLVSPPYAGADAKVGAGTLTIRFGTVADGGFAADGGAPLEIAVSAEDTLETLALKLGGGGSGLAAHVVHGPAGAQLVVKGREGASRGFTVAGMGEGDGTVPGQLGHLGWDPAGDPGRLTRQAADAAFLFDGVPMASPTNRVEGLPAGLSLSLAATNAGAPTAIAVAARTEAIAAVMGDLVAALNEVAAKLGSSAAPVGGELGNDAGARGLKRALRTLPGDPVMPNAVSGVPSRLADLGLALTREGTFRFDAARLRDTLAADPQGAAALFTPGLYGVYATVDKLARGIGLAGDPGSLGGSVARYQRQQGQAAARLQRIGEQQEALRAQLAQRLGQGERRVAASQGTLDFLRNQIAAWNAVDR